MDSFCSNVPNPWKRFRTHSNASERIETHLTRSYGMRLHEIQRNVPDTHRNARTRKVRDGLHHGFDPSEEHTLRGVNGRCSIRTAPDR